jgi:hypothetical protein
MIASGLISGAVAAAFAFAVLFAAALRRWSSPDAVSTTIEPGSPVPAHPVP